MTREEALHRVKGYLTDIIPVENYSEIEEIFKALKQEPCEDVISRQAAIDALNEYFARIGRLKRKGLTKEEKAISLDTVGTIKTLPSAQLRPKGNWIHSIYYGEIMPEHKCSECGTWEYSDEESNFCSYCGADMRREK